MTDEEDNIEAYATHADRLSWVIDDVDARRDLIAKDLRAAFSGFIETRQTEWIVFDRVTVDELAKIFKKHPTVLKPVTTICNIAGRAIKRDLGFNVDTYKPRLTDDQANQLAGYVKPFLPKALAIPALEAIDEWWFVDKEIRAFQGRWEKHTEKALIERTGLTFKKRMIAVPNDQGIEDLFELDAASPATGEPIDVAIDVKRIGSHLDIHKRVDEIANKAEKYKKKYPSGVFGAVIYFPFSATEQTNITNRLRGPNVDGIVFAGESMESVERAILLLIPQLGMTVIDATPPEDLQSKLDLSDDS